MKTIYWLIRVVLAFVLTIGIALILGSLASVILFALLRFFRG